MDSSLLRSNSISSLLLSQVHKASKPGWNFPSCFLLFTWVVSCLFLDPPLAALLNEINRRPPAFADSSPTSLEGKHYQDNSKTSLLRCTLANTPSLNLDVLWVESRFCGLCALCCIQPCWGVGTLGGADVPLSVPLRWTSQPLVYPEARIGDSPEYKCQQVTMQEFKPGTTIWKGNQQTQLGSSSLWLA